MQITAPIVSVTPKGCPTQECQQIDDIAFYSVLFVLWAGIILIMVLAIKTKK
jgi:hypothetical protein